VAGARKAMKKRYTNPVHGYVLNGRHYLERDWVAKEGGYVYENLRQCATVSRAQWHVVRHSR
jgi:hypothetical protein